MSKFNFKSEYLTTPVKLVLPGLIVATAGFYLFNNPAKRKANDTYYNWNIIKEYEAGLTKATEESVCSSDTLDQIKFRKDFTHQLQILVNNLSDLKKDNNVDKLLDAYLNIKIARYTEAKKITEDYLDTVVVINQAAMQNPYDQRYQAIADNKLSEYIKELAHIETRDSSALRSIANQLTKQHHRYVDSFLISNNSLQPLPEMERHFTGRWAFPELLVTIEFKKDQTGTWEVNGQEVPFTWTRDEHMVTLKTATEEQNFLIIKAGSNSMTLIWREKKLPTIGCRKE